MDFDPETTLSRAGQTVDSGPRGDGTSSHSPASHSIEPAGRTNGTSSPRPSSSPRTTLEQTLADLDGGAGAVACSTGRSAMAAVTHLLDADAHLICGRECSADTAQFFSHLDERGTLSVSYRDPSNLQALTTALRPTTAALWVETPSNLRLRIADLDALSEFADANDLLLIVDNTVLSPVAQRPLDLGADLVVYSSIQRLNGHSDVTGGAVVAHSTARAEALDSIADAYGLYASPADSKLILRGTKTLSVRVQQHEKNARSVVYELDAHPAVNRVFYPGLRTHPGHKAARRQQDGYGSLVSIAVDETVNINALFRAFNVFSVGQARGSVESTIEHPASMSRASSPHAPHEGATIPPNLVRLSVGIESTDDLLHDLERALDTARAPETEPAHTPQPVQTRT